MKTSELKEAVLQYIGQDGTDYAFLITGNWGCGKTYFWQNQIVPVLNSDSEGKSKYTVIYVSLYGVTEANQITSTVLCQALPAFGQKMGRTASHFARAAMKHYGVEDLISDAPIKKLSKLITGKKQMVICVDDLERVGMDIKDTMGIINEYVEHVGAKVIILCDEEKIRRKNEDYAGIKEKVVRVTRTFDVDHGPAIGSIIKSFSKNKPFLNMLKANRTVIADLFKKSKSNNLRLLKYGLSLLRIAFDSDAEGILPTGRLIWTVLPAAFDFQSGSLEREDVLKVVTSGGIAGYSIMANESDEPSPIQVFIDKYEFEILSQNRIFESEPLASMIVTGYLDKVAFAAQLDEMKAKDSIEYMAVKHIGRDWRELDDDQFAKEFEIALSEVRKGKVNKWQELIQLMRAMSFCVADGLIAKDDSNLKDAFEKGLNQLIKSGEFDVIAGHIHDLEFLHGDENDLTKWLYARIIEKNSSALYDERKKRVDQAFEALKSEPDILAQLVCSEDENSLRAQPLHELIDPSVLVLLFVGIPNHSKMLVAAGFHARYRDFLPRELLPELPWVQSIVQKLDDWLNSNQDKKGPSLYHIKRLHSVMKYGEERLTGLQGLAEAQAKESDNV